MSGRYAKQSLGGWLRENAESEILNHATTLALLVSSLVQTHAAVSGAVAHGFAIAHHVHYGVSEERRE